MAVTFEDIQRILSGEPIEIETPYPFAESGENFRWFMKQPEDFLYDMGNAARDAAVAVAKADESIMLAFSIPADADWVRNQKLAIQQTKEKIEALESKKQAATILPEEDIELANCLDHASRLLDPDTYTRGDEIVNSLGRKAIVNYMMPRLVVDINGKLLFNLDTKKGKLEWLRLGQEVKSAMARYFWEAYLLVLTAKNYKSDQNSL